MRWWFLWIYQICWPLNLKRKSKQCATQSCHSKMRQSTESLFVFALSLLFNSYTVFDSSPLSLMFIYTVSVIQPPHERSMFYRVIMTFCCECRLFSTSHQPISQMFQRGNGLEEVMEDEEMMKCLTKLHDAEASHSQWMRKGLNRVVLTQTYSTFFTDKVAPALVAAWWSWNTL